MEATDSSEMLVPVYQPTQLHDPEVLKFHAVGSRYIASHCVAVILMQYRNYCSPIR
jgi:hypothetical protein